MTDIAETAEGGKAMRPKTGMAGPARTGWLVFITLLVLVVLEYIIFLVMDMNLPIMVLMNVADAALIMYYFMHVTRLWKRADQEEGA